MLWGWLALGCGPVLGTSGGEIDGSTGGPSSTDDAGTQTSAEPPGDTGGIDTSAGDDDSTDTGTPAELLCGAASPSEPLLVLTGDNGALVVRGDGSTETLAMPVIPGIPPRPLAVDARGDHVAVAIGSQEFIGTWQAHGTVATFDAAGTPGWAYDAPDALITGLHVRDDGSVTATRDHEGGEQHGVVLAGPELVAAVADFRPLDARDPGGVVAGVFGDGTVLPVPGWLLGDGVTTRVASREPLAGWFRHDDGAFAYLAAQGGATHLVIEDPQDLSMEPIDALGGLAPVRVSSGSARRWWLLEIGEAEQWFRLSLDDAAAEPIELTPPLGFDPLECYYPAPVLDAHGRVMLATRNATRAQIHRLDPATGQWDTVGEPVTAVDTLAVVAIGDSYVLSATGSNMTFCPPQSFEPEPYVLAGTSTQLLHEDGAAYVLPYAPSTVRDDGDCAVLATTDGVVVLDVRDGTELAVPGYVGASWWAP